MMSRTMVRRGKLKSRWLSGMLALLMIAFLYPSVVHAGDTIQRIVVPNSGFEDELQSGAIPSWSYWSGSPLTTGASLSYTKKFAGTSSMRIVKSSTTASLGMESAKLAVKAGETYDAAIKLNVEAVNTNGAPHLWLRWYDSSGQLLLNKDVKTIVSPVTLNKWLDVRVKGTAPWDAATAILFVYIPANTTISANVDDAQFYRTADYNSLLNPGFEEFVDPVIPGWSLTNGMPANTSIARSTSEIPVGGGTASIGIDNTNSPTNAIGLQSDPIPVTAGSRYEAKANVKLIAGSQKVFIKFYSSTNGTGELAAFPYGVSNAPNWTSFKYSAVAPSGAQSARVVLISDQASGGKAYYDNLSFFVTGLEVSYAKNSPINLGQATLGTLTTGGAMKNNEIYFATNGSPATFYAFNATTRDLIYKAPVPGTDVVWGITGGIG